MPIAILRQIWTPISPLYKSIGYDSKKYVKGLCKMALSCRRDYDEYVFTEIFIKGLLGSIPPYSGVLELEGKGYSPRSRPSHDTLNKLSIRVLFFEHFAPTY